MNDQEIAEIEKEAKEILDKFSRSLTDVKLGMKENKLNSCGFREEGSGVPCDSSFRERMFANASSKNEDSIIAEKKKW